MRSLSYRHANTKGNVLQFRHNVLLLIMQMRQTPRTSKLYPENTASSNDRLMLSWLPVKPSGSRVLLSIAFASASTLEHGSRVFRHVYVELIFEASINRAA